PRARREPGARRPAAGPARTPRRLHVARGHAAPRGRAAVSWTVGVDIGGTFTDLTVLSPDGHVLLWKEDTTPDQLEQAIERGLAAAAGQLGVELRAFLSGISLFVHGSTVATNTIIQRNGPRVGLVCTRGFRDALYFRDGFKWDRFNPRLPRPPDFADRYLR